jgi:hypothetical protein
MTGTASGTAVAGQYSNIGNATGTSPTGSKVSATDPDHYFGSQSSIDVEKYVKDNSATWQDADSGTGPYIPSTPNPVVFKFTIYNGSDAALSGVDLTDTDMTSFFDDEACTTPATFPTTLAVGETKTYYGNLAWAAGQHEDEATADGTPPVGSEVSDKDKAHYFGSTQLPCPAGYFDWSMDQSGNLTMVFDQFPAPNDNSYGVNAVGWPGGHTFSNLTGSDKAGFQLVDQSGGLPGVVKLSFNIDYISAKTGTPSGYGSLGPFGGDGGILVGTLTPGDISFESSLQRNLNDTGYFAGGVPVVDPTFAVANLLVDSPPTQDKSGTTPLAYVLTPPAAGNFTNGWDFHDTYFVTIKATKLAAIGFNINTWKVEPNLTVLHNSPAKPCPGATTLTVASATGYYCGTVNLSATLKSAAGTALSNRTIAFTLNGSPAGSAVTNSSGTATLAGASLANIPVGSYATGVGASFAGDASYDANSATAKLTVNAPTLKVLTPKSGAVWPIGSGQTITWTPVGCGTVDILLSRDDGHNWTTIIDDTPDDGSEQWTQVTAPATTSARIKVVHAAASGTSAKFTIKR